MKSRKTRAVIFCSILLASGVSTCLAAAPKIAVNPSDYPVLTDKDLGHIRRMVNLSQQLPGDWSGMSDDLWAVAERTRQFQLAYMAEALGLVQHNYTPAYRELYRRAMDSLIQKMTNPDIWMSWLKSSRGGTAFNDPDSKDLGHGWIDPVVRYNAMLKGYLLQNGAMYEMLYRDGKYDRPDAFTFKYEPFTWGDGPVIFRYALGDIAEIVHKEYVESNYEGIQCEPNRIFPSCQQPPILGLLQYDQVHGTHYADDVMPKFAANWKRLHYTDPASGQNAHFIYAKQKWHKLPGTPVLDGWAGAWMHAWDPDMMKDIYPKQRDLYLKSFLDGEYAKNAPPQGPEYGNRTMISLAFGQFAFMAAEMGDTEARTGLVDYADRNFHPVWENGAYYYPRSDDYVPDANGDSHGVDSWTGNVLIALARLDKGDGFYKVYHNPWTEKQLDEPQIVDVDYLLANVSQAWYDDSKSALIVTLKPGPVKSEKTTFSIIKLDPASDYEIWKDGKLIATLGQGPVSGAARNIASRGADGTVTVTTDIASPHSFVVIKSAEVH